MTENKKISAFKKVFREGKADIYHIFPPRTRKSKFVSDILSLTNFEGILRLINFNKKRTSAKGKVLL